MAEVTPLPAASVIALRDSPLEVLMLRRSESASFVPNTWVFPGGVMDDADRGDFRVTAARELFEETGIVVDVHDLVATSRWITPLGLPKRFDTWFFLARVPRDVAVTIQESEVVDFLWMSSARRDLKMVFPTIKNLEAIAGFESADELIESRRNAVIEPVMPVLFDGRPALR